jgi:PAS domain S-box-containing protein
MAKHLTMERHPEAVDPARPAPPTGAAEPSLAPSRELPPVAPPAAAPPDLAVLVFLRRLSAVVGSVVAALAAVVLLGWGFGGSAAAHALSPGSAPLRPLIAVCLLLLAVSTWALAERLPGYRRRIGMAGAAAALALAVLVIAEYAVGIDPGLDRLLFADGVRATWPGPHAGRIPLERAILIGLLAAAQLVMQLRVRWAPSLSQAGTLVAGVLSLTEVYGAVYAYAGSAPERQRGLPLVAALALLALCLSTIAARPSGGLTRVMASDSVGAVMGRRLLGAALTIPFLLGLLLALAQGGQFRTRFGVAELVAGNAVAFGVVSFVVANAASRLEAVGTAAQRAARDGHAQLMALIDNTSAVIYMRDVAGRYMLVNREYERLFGVGRDDILGRTDHDLFPGDIADAFRENDIAAVARGTPVQMEEVAPGDDGPHSYVTVKFPILDENGTAYAVCGISTDITDRTRAEAEVRRLNSDLERRVRERTAELEASTRELDAFAYSVSHDLRAPLRSLDGFSQVLLDDYADVLDESGQDCLRRLQANTGRMAQIIDDLLDLSRATRVELRRNPVDLSELARVVIAELRQAEPGRQVEVTIADHLNTTGDPQLLRLVLVNLLGNAWKFTERSPAATVRFELAADSTEQVFAVRDNGAGFKMEYAAKLFEPFQRLHSRGEFEGSGLGLAIVARILRRHGGRIWAEGAPGEGAAFYFTVTAPPEDLG